MLNVKRIEKKFSPDCSRVIAKPHIPKNEEHIKRIINRVLTLSEEQVNQILNSVIEKFSSRHKNVLEILNHHYNKIRDYIPREISLTPSRIALMGAYFTCEYSVQGAAFFNPSIILHPDQENLEEGSSRYIISFRSVGEGHISSIEFRTCIIDKDCNFEFDKASCFAQKASNILHINDTDYILQFKKDDLLSEKVIFPAAKNDCNGIEDARFVRFVDDDGSVTYYATYTAYDGHNILPQMIETKDFNTFKVFSLNGKYSKNKGMALFPRKINGKYAMISRVDGQNLYIMYSDDLCCWEKADVIKEPEQSWEFVQIGNCGSPIETEGGWILLTHGVGPMREYSIGVIVLDIENPAKIVSNINEPLLICNSEEREGYVPNVVYSCGSIVHNDTLIMPYAMSDIISGIVKVSVAEILNNTKNKEMSESYAKFT